MSTSTREEKHGKRTRKRTGNAEGKAHSGKYGKKTNNGYEERGKAKCTVVYYSFFLFSCDSR